MTRVDHTSIDVVAYDPSTKQRLGITVKSRTRVSKTEKDPVNLFRQEQKDDWKKFKQACKAFACEPWIAVYVEAAESADVYFTSLKNYDAKYRGKKGKAVEDWKMSKKASLRYQKDAKFKHIRIQFIVDEWWNIASNNTIA